MKMLNEFSFIYKLLQFRMKCMDAFILFASCYYVLDV